MNRRKHVPIRTCVICGCKGEKKQLLRLSLDERNLVVWDELQVQKGRGAYVCPGCLPKLTMTNRLKKAFRDKAKGINIDIKPIFKDSKTIAQNRRQSRGDVRSRKSDAPA